MEDESKSWNPRGGRPKKNENELRNKPVLIKFTEDEKKRLYQESKDLGWSKPIVYFRNKLLSKEGGVKHNPQELFKALNELGPELSKVAANINRVARYVNYLDKNNMIDAKFIGEYNVHFKRLIEVQHKYTVAIKAYLRTLVEK